MIHVGMGDEDRLGGRQVYSGKMRVVGTAFARVKPEQPSRVLDGERDVMSTRLWLRAAACPYKGYLNAAVELGLHEGPHFLRSTPQWRRATFSS